MPTPAPMPMIDTHCHLDVPVFADDVDEIDAAMPVFLLVPMRVIDTHCHLDAPAFADDVDELDSPPCPDRCACPYPCA